MELKNVNPNGDNVVISNLNNVNYYFVKIEIKDKYCMLFFFQDVAILHRTNFFILFTLLINIE
jgi:hypothetical protein